MKGFNVNVRTPGSGVPIPALEDRVVSRVVGGDLEALEVEL